MCVIHKKIFNIQSMTFPNTGYTQNTHKLTYACISDISMPRYNEAIHASNACLCVAGGSYIKPQNEVKPLLQFRCVQKHD